ncbi:MAG TPA: carboxypeptidase-like regulatory domain-containing protein [Thermoguttaceae bacterium]|nr:carboxypeptidase-like regulatory domain-containing protein [Thermoguttaceae bacterium]
MTGKDTGYTFRIRDRKISSALAPTIAIGGKVTDGMGKPVSGAEIWLRLFTRERHVLHAKSEAQGRFVLEVPSAWVAELPPWDRANTLWAYASGDQWPTGGYQPGPHLGTAKVAPSGGASDVVVRLGPTFENRFTVLDPEGRPCEGALVEPYYIRTSLGYEPVPEWLLARIGVRTDAEGRVKLPAVPPDLLYQVRVTTPDFGIQLQRTDGSEPRAVVGRTIRLRPVGKIEGRVLADQPEMARGVRLVFTSEQVVNEPAARSTEAWLTEGFADVESDEQGRFVVPAMATGTVRIDAYVDDELPLRPRVPPSVEVLPNHTTTLDVPMAPTVVVRGSVRATDTGEPIPGVRVHVYYGVGRQGADPVSDAQGRYTAPVLPGPIRLQVIYMPEEYVQSRGVGFPFPSYEVPADAKVFELPPLEAVPAKSITGRVIDESDQPVANVRISILVGNRYFGHGKSDRNGRFNLTGVPTTIDPAKVKYQWNPEVGSTMPSECEVVKANPLVLRTLPRAARIDRP